MKNLKHKKSRTLMTALVAAVVGLICTPARQAMADTISNADLVGGTPTVSLATGWTAGSYPVTLLFDGNADNPGTGRVLYWHGGTTLSQTNYISITIDLIEPWEINSFQIANDYGNSSVNEVHSMDILLSGTAGLIKSFLVSNLDDDYVPDIDDVFTGESILGVTRIEFRITENQDPWSIEIREFIVTGTPAPSNQPPVAVCQAAVVAVGEVPNIDGGSYDPDDGDTVTLSQSPSGAFGEAGIYEVTLTVTDSSDASDTCTAMVVVYDPSGGFVTGGGWIDSPEGAYIPDPSLTGKANFGFVSKYKKGASIPTGQTEFVFQTAGLNFHSSSYQWLVVNQAGANAQFKGSGTINGEGDYKFMLWAGDGEPDTFRIKIWYEDTGEVVVYDNGVNQAIGGGSIIVHKAKK